ncbi:CbtA family protein [Mycobacterium sp.]|uniref:CbtA family protein n=1 Tax=Mycobacterium sp. TaxID=1785 RepID=UPI003F943E8D
METRVIGRGAVAGLIAGVLGIVFARIWAEPVIAKSIDYESRRTAVLAALNTAAGRPVAPEGPEIFSRAMQSTVGLTTGIIVSPTERKPSGVDTGRRCGGGLPVRPVGWGGSGGGGSRAIRSLIWTCQRVTRMSSTSRRSNCCFWVSSRVSMTAWMRAAKSCTRRRSWLSRASAVRSSARLVRLCCNVFRREETSVERRCISGSSMKPPW